MSATDSINGVAERIAEWIKLQEPGVVWIRYSNDVSRDLCLDRFRGQLSLPPIVFQPPQPENAATWLEEKLQSVEAPAGLAVISVQFPISLH